MERARIYCGYSVGKFYDRINNGFLVSEEAVLEALLNYDDKPSK